MNSEGIGLIFEIKAQITVGQAQSVTKEEFAVGEVKGDQLRLWAFW